MWRFRKKPCAAFAHDVWVSGVLLSLKRGGKRRRQESHRCRKCKWNVVRHPIQTHLWLACQDYDEVNDK